jgi:uncharacterized membrane protein
MKKLLSVIFNGTVELIRGVWGAISKTLQSLHIIILVSYVFLLGIIILGICMPNNLEQALNIFEKVLKNP